MSVDKEEIVEQDRSPIQIGDVVWWSYGEVGMSTGKIVGYTDDTQLIAVIKRGRHHTQIPIAALQKLILQR